MEKKVFIVLTFIVKLHLGRAETYLWNKIVFNTDLDMASKIDSYTLSFYKV